MLLYLHANPSVSCLSCFKQGKENLRGFFFSQDINSALFFLKLIFLNNPLPLRVRVSYLCSPFLLHSLPPSWSIHCSLMCHLPVSKQCSTTLAQLGPKWVATPHKRWRTMLSPGQKQVKHYFVPLFPNDFFPPLLPPSLCPFCSDSPAWREKVVCGKVGQPFSYSRGKAKTRSVEWGCWLP